MTRFLVEIKEVSTYGYWEEADTGEQAREQATQNHDAGDVTPDDIDWDSTRVYVETPTGMELESWDD